MGDLLVLPPSRARTRDTVAGVGAEILFFTGVRYYRMDETSDAAPVVATAKRRPTRTKRRPQPPFELHA